MQTTAKAIHGEEPLTSSLQAIHAFSKLLLELQPKWLIITLKLVVLLVGLFHVEMFCYCIVQSLIWATLPLTRFKHTVETLYIYSIC